MKAYRVVKVYLFSFSTSALNMVNGQLYCLGNVAGDQKKFKSALKKLLYTYSFYTMEEYLS